MLVKETNNNKLFEKIEFAKCSVNPIYYIETYGHVYDVGKKKRGLMKCFEYQKRCLKMFHNYTNSIVLKSRQTGLSVITSAYVAWRLLFNKDEKILIIANDGIGAKRFLKLVKQFIELSPKFLKSDEQMTDNQNKIEFSNGSWAEARASSPNAGRGDSLTLLVLDETAFIKDDYDIFMAAGIALSMTGGKCIMISTPNGTGNLYYETWVDAEKKMEIGEGIKEDSFRTMRIHWTENPIAAKGLELRKDDNGEEYFWSPWYEAQKEKLLNDEVRIAQELDLDFGGSKRLAVENSIIKKYIQKAKDKEPKFYFEYDFNSVNNVWENLETIFSAGSFKKEKSHFHIWELPKEGGRYIIGVDVSSGVGKDYSTIQIIDIENLEQVAEYQCKVPVDMFPKLVYCISRHYNNAFLVIESNTFGLGVALDLKNKFNYSNLFFSKSFKKIHVSQYDMDVSEGEDIPGFQTSPKTRPLMINNLIVHLRAGQLIINSMRLMREFETFIVKKTETGEKPQAENGFNDDLIMAIAIALYIRDTEYINSEASKHHYKAMLDAMITSNSSSISSINQEKHHVKNPMGIFIGNKEEDTHGIDDSGWLLG